MEKEKDIEKDIEKYLIQQVSKWRGICWKFTSPGTRGVPDRYCAVLGKQFFVELKRPNAKARADEKLQKARARQLDEAGVRCYTLSTRQDIDLLFRYLENGILPGVKYFARI